MFCRLVWQKKFSSSDIVALGFDFERMQRVLNPEHALFSTNPAYDGCLRLAGWDNRNELDWSRLQVWRWNNDFDLKEIKKQKSAIRQAELDVFAFVPLSLLDHVVTDTECPAQVRELHCKRVVIKNLNIW